MDVEQNVRKAICNPAMTGSGSIVNGKEAALLRSNGTPVLPYIEDFILSVVQPACSAGVTVEDKFPGLHETLVVYFQLCEPGDFKRAASLLTLLSGDVLTTGLRSLSGLWSGPNGKPLPPEVLKFIQYLLRHGSGEQHQVAEQLLRRHQRYVDGKVDLRHQCHGEERKRGKPVRKKWTPE